MGEIRLSRVHDREPGLPGRVYLVDRLWPRGVRKADVAMDGWLRDVAPSAELRRWFAHDLARWQEFRRRYLAELEAHPQRWQPLLEDVRRGEVTLLYGARDREHNNAVVLREFLLAHEDGAGRS
jgi:uncharacterized protein YeaO (DUF488 family)